MNVRAKFYCVSIKATGYKNGDRDIELAPVYSDNPNHENKAFWSATPSGKLELYINGDDDGNPRPAASAFEPGQEYYIDISPAPPTTAAD